MKRIECFSVIILFFMVIALAVIDAHAGYWVEFKTGRRISVDGYQIQGNTVHLYFGGGTVKVPKDEVKAITQKKEETPSKLTEAFEEEKEDVTPAEVKLSKASPSGEGKESYLKRKAELSEKLEEAKKAYFEATDKSEKEKERKKMTALSKELFLLEEEVMKKNNGTLPEWWKEN